eukprot:TRINITY_DN39_c2_g1_i1.p1 TRINITY_DN39_c2_g1~~TRINITY_DN39_c2_g1_i1.p1  ORF type:complete len:738 (+),score=135.33 TRINITY_DN39_c2_g1_i1:123-2336(+)
MSGLIIKREKKKDEKKKTVSREQSLDHVFSNAKEGDVKALARALQDVNTNGVSVVLDSHQQTPLHVAALEGRYDVVKYLIDSGAEVNARDKNNWTALHCSAATQGERTEAHLDVCELLLRSGADSNMVTLTNTSVMHYLVRHKYSEKLKQVLELLRAKGADIDVMGINDETPLHQAAFKGSPETCIFLIVAGAGANSLNKNGETPLHHAARAGQKAVVETLLRYGSDPYIIGENGTAREVAFLCNQQDVIDILDEYMQDEDEDEADLKVVEIHPKHISRSDSEGRSISRQISKILPKSDASEVFGLSKLDSSGSTIERGASIPKLIKTQKKTGIIVSHVDFNLEKGNRSMQVPPNDMSLECTDEHDDYYYLSNFVKDPTTFLGALNKSDLPDNESLESFFHKHINIVGKQDASLIIITIKQEHEDNQLRGLLRTKEKDTTIWLSAHDFELAKEPKPTTGKTVSFNSIIKVLYTKYPSLQDLERIKEPTFCKYLVSLDQILKVQRYKFSVIYCKGQKSEDTIFDADEPSPELVNFMKFLGNEVQLEGWKGYKGDLDVKHGTTGKISYHTIWNNLEIMFQMSHFLPKDRRKAVVGNCITTIIFQDGGSFDPSTITSQVSHIFVVIKPLHGMVGSKGLPLYKVGITSKKGVPRFRPSLLHPAVYEQDEGFRELLFHKLINGERAAYHCSAKFRRQVRSLVEIVQHNRLGQMEYAVQKAREKDLQRKSSSPFTSFKNSIGL